MPEVVWTANVDAPPCLAGTGEATVVEGQATDLLVRLEPANEGMLHYIVTDEAGNPVPGAYVRYVSENEECVPRARQNLDDQGKGDQPVGPGTHTVRVMHNDYLPHTQDVTMVAGGEETIEVVLKTGQAKVTSEAIVILDKVYFETAKDVIKTESYGLLDQVASILEAHTEIKKVEVSGHTDSQGNDDYNMDLSDRRAKSVRTYLMNKGIDGARLDAKGYGETKPIDTNATSAGRAMNRRVEFNITEQAAEESDAQDVQPAGKGAEKKPDAAPAESGDATPAEKTVEKKGTEAAAAAATGATDKAKADADKAATEAADKAKADADKAASDAADKAKADADKAKADAEKAATDKAADEAGKAMDKVTGGGK